MSDILGCDLWNDSGEYNVQTNDPTEELYRKLISEIQVKYPEIHWGYLESCGPNAMINCLAVTNEGRSKINALTKTLGVYSQQAPHILIGYFNDPNNYHKFLIIREGLNPGSVQGNRVPQYYPLAARDVFNIKATIEWNMTFDAVIAAVRDGTPIQACLKQPSHYVSIKAYDPHKDVLVGDDSWPGRTGVGFNVEFSKEEFFKNFEAFFIKYWVR